MSRSSRRSISISTWTLAGRASSSLVIEARGEPIVNPVTKEEHRARLDMPDGFEFTIAEVGRGWAKTAGAIELNLADSHAHFAKLHITGTGVVR